MSEKPVAKDARWQGKGLSLPRQQAVVSGEHFVILSTVTDCGFFFLTRMQRFIAMQQICHFE
jgi:hypothetical protein